MKQVLIGAAAVLVGASAAVAQVPQSRHVVLVVEENHSFESVMAPNGMSYLKSLGDKYVVMTNYYANYHPSIGNYFVMTTGTAVSTDDHYSGTVSGETIVSQIAATGKKWKLYSDALPRAGYLGGNRRPYVKRHVAPAYFDSVRNDDKQGSNVVPVEQFASDLQSADGLPDLSIVIPNLDHDAHDGTLQEADQWLEKTVAPLLDDPKFKQDGMLIITFDESFKEDVEHGGGHIVTIVIGPKAKTHFNDTTFYQHQSLLATLEDALGVPRLGIVAQTPNFANAFK
ncbi:MAG: alkaline phosphatase family protein [Acidobacteriota bacterium]